MGGLDGDIAFLVRRKGLKRSNAVLFAVSGDCFLAESGQDMDEELAITWSGRSKKTSRRDDTMTRAGTRSGNFKI